MYEKYDYMYYEIEKAGHKPAFSENGYDEKNIHHDEKYVPIIIANLTFLYNKDFGYVRKKQPGSVFF